MLGHFSSSQSGCGCDHRQSGDSSSAYRRHLESVWKTPGGGRDQMSWAGGGRESHGESRGDSGYQQCQCVCDLGDNHSSLCKNIEIINLINL